MDTLAVAKNVVLLRGVCSKRLKFDIEFSRKRGTTDNSYLLKVHSHLQIFPLGYSTPSVPCTPALMSSMFVWTDQPCNNLTAGRQQQHPH